MRLFNLFRSSSAPIARERLQILLAHERMASNHSDLLGVLREEILAVIGRHLSLEPDRVRIEMDRGKTVSTLAVDIEIPNGFGTSSLIPLHGLPLNDQASLDSGRNDGISGIEHSVV
jgi:cell division topological specificity factor